ncbi:glycosyltransferase [Raineyella fluvialis]|uniref:Glycosyltransferase n=1 Tax=Raineyella fluvialis TaxID=2662261 RepID=A0A5Q2FGP8_9ACTN|nr:glycosyltransferase [Raineyella fluvialis]QGF23875.1 glycosyltransferase [Raineyella fluvialis]
MTRPGPIDSATLDLSPVDLSGVRIALAHDYLTQRGGAERVMLSLMRAFPGAPIHTTLYDPDATFPDFRSAEIVTSPLNRIGLLRRDHRRALPLLAWASESVRIDADVVIVSTSGWAHAFPTTGRRLVYCHNPARWLYQTEEYLGDAGLFSPRRLALAALGRPLRSWDRRAAHRADRYLANSRVVARRVADTYGMTAGLVPPPHSIDASGTQEPISELRDWADGFHLIVSRLLPYKNVDKALGAFRSLPDERLVVVGAGPMEGHLRAMAPPNARMVSGLTDAQLRWAYAHASALIAPSYEDFGLTPLEAAAFGRPTLALHAGGYLDTIDPAVNGAFFEASTAWEISAAVSANRGRDWDSAAILRHAEGFSEERFIARLRAEVAALVGR